MEENQRLEESNLSLEGELPSLVKLSAMKIVIEVWRYQDITTAFEDDSWTHRTLFPRESATDNFGILTNLIRRKLEIIRPRILREQTSEFVTPIGLHLCEYITFTRRFMPFLSPDVMVKSIIWTVYGNIDYYRSVDLLIDITRILCNEEDFLQMSFSIACTTCNERQIHNLWNIMPDLMRRGYCSYFSTSPHTLLLVYFVQFYLQKREHEFRNILRQFSIMYLNDYSFFNTGGIEKVMFAHAVHYAKSFAMSYFYPKLLEVIKQNRAIFCFRHVLGRLAARGVVEPEKVDIAISAFFKMTKIRQIFVLNCYADRLFSLMVSRWRYQKFLPHLAKQTSDILTGSDFYWLFGFILEKSLLGSFVEEHLIEKIWSAVSESIKRQFFRNVKRDMTTLYELEKYATESYLFIMEDSFVSERNAIYSFCEI